MGNSLSSWGGQKKVASIIDKAGLPLQIDSSGEGDTKRELSRFTRAYAASGWFTGVRSTVTVPGTPDVVFNSLSKDLQEVFTPMSECHDEIREDNHDGKQIIYRIVRIPFKVAFVTGNLKLRLNVAQNSKEHHITFESAQEGRLITKFIADFQIRQHEEDATQSIVELDAKVDAKSLPPPPFKNMVKDVMVSKMDSCMVDLVEFHERRAAAQEEDSAEDSTERFYPAEEGETSQHSKEAERRQASNASTVEYEAASSTQSGTLMDRQASQGFDFQRRRQQQQQPQQQQGGGGILAAIRRSLGNGLPQRRSFETRRSMEKRRQMRQRRSLEQSQAIQRMASASALHGARTQPEASKPPPSPPDAAQKPPLPPSQVSVFERWQATQSPFDTR